MEAVNIELDENDKARFVEDIDTGSILCSLPLYLHDVRTAPDS